MKRVEKGSPASEVVECKNRDPLLTIPENVASYIPLFQWPSHLIRTTSALPTKNNNVGAPNKEPWENCHPDHRGRCLEVPSLTAQNV